MNTQASYELSEILSLFDFSFVMDEGKIALIDNQGANLGDIESERFETVEQVFERMDVYINDTLLDGEILLDNPEISFADCEEAYEYCKKNRHEKEASYLFAIINPETVLIQ